MRKFIGLLIVIVLGGTSWVYAQEVTLKLVHTTDVHGNMFPYDFINQKEWGGSMARVSSFVKEQRKMYGERLLLMDNGDILQGQPTAYYYNFIDTLSVHAVAEIMNYMKYDVGNMGNHDIEAGHQVYDRWVRQCKHPVLGANIMDVATGKPYLPPYVVFHREGVKVAVLGLITPSVPSWLPENLWKGLRFDDMVTSAAHWVKVIQETENPDVLVGVFHAGKSGNLLGKVVENPSHIIAEQIPGFDVVMIGHDHEAACQHITNVAGKQVLLVNPANNANLVSDVTVKITREEGKVVSKKCEGKLVDINRYAPDEAFMNYFGKQFASVKEFVSRKIGYMASTITTKDAYFGPSAFIDLIHRLQLDISGAQVSFCAPLSFLAEIKEGNIRVSDMFNLYKYENMLYVMELTGKEIKDYLEMSYAHWTHQMKNADDHLLLLRKESGYGERGKFQHPSYNFDSAAGIRYTVDVTQPEGKKLHIISMADGTPFASDKVYRVALNSYRGNGGGDLLTKGAGIPKEKLAERIVFSTDKDLRYYLMKYIEQVKVLNPVVLNQWKFVPEEWVKDAAKRDYQLLFGDY